jgi:soluble lytic murein transglycosylase
LPEGLKNSAPVQARLARDSNDLDAVQAVLRRWPQDPASWELQWQLARQLALAGNWRASLQVLSEPALQNQLPAPLEARRWFWQGLAEWQLGRQQQARQIWQELLARYPGGYYGWRAADRLGQGQLNLRSDTDAPLPQPTWTSLNKRCGGDRSSLAPRSTAGSLGAMAPAHPKGRAPPIPASWRWKVDCGGPWATTGSGWGSWSRPACGCRPSGATWRATWSRTCTPRPTPTSWNKRPTVLGWHRRCWRQIAKQESRFSPTVRSPVGAVGLLQLMPDTAAEVAGGAVSETDLEDPGRNADLGARYLNQLLGQWQNNPVLAAASYNAGPGAVSGWIDPRLNDQPELWVEAIPYPETRLYVKKVLGNLWSMTAPRPPACTPLNAPASGPARPLPAPPR